MPHVRFSRSTFLRLKPRSRGAFFACVNGNRNRPGFTETRLRGWAARRRTVSPCIGSLLARRPPTGRVISGVRSHAAAADRAGRDRGRDCDRRLVHRRVASITSSSDRMYPAARSVFVRPFALYFCDAKHAFRYLLGAQKHCTFGARNVARNRADANSRSDRRQVDRQNGPRSGPR
jgi:hypothetical protein